MDVALIAALAALSSAVVAALVVWLISTHRIKATQAALAEQSERATRAEITLESERAVHAAALAAQRSSEQQLRESFASLSSEALKSSNEQFLHLAQERLERQQQAAKGDLSSLIEPLRETLTRQEQQVRGLESARQAAYGSIEAQLQRMTEDQQRLQSETAGLVRALRQPSVRGRWGELQLRRVVELAGMSAQCDFCEQQTIRDDNGTHQRPDMQIRLPNNRQIIVDAKVPLEAYLEAVEAPDETHRNERLSAHARQVRQHVDAMCKRDYQVKVDGSHDFVVLFIPGEVFYSAALEQDHELLEHAFRKNVIITTPTTLIALLKAVALGWREARLAEEAHKIQYIGAELYERLNVVANHLNKLGKNLTQSVGAYNDAVGSIEARLLSSARRMHELGIGTNELAELTDVREVTRPFRQPELLISQERG